MLLALDEGLLRDQLVLDDADIAIMQELGDLLQRHIQHPQIADGVEHLELLDAIVTVSGTPIDVCGFQQPASLVMTKRAQGDVEHASHLPDAEQPRILRHGVIRLVTLRRQRSPPLPKARCDA